MLLLVGDDMNDFVSTATLTPGSAANSPLPTPGAEASAGCSSRTRYAAPSTPRRWRSRQAPDAEAPAKAVVAARLGTAVATVVIATGPTDHGVPVWSRAHSRIAAMAVRSRSRGSGTHGPIWSLGALSGIAAAVAEARSRPKRGTQGSTSSRLARWDHRKRMRFAPSRFTVSFGPRTVVAGSRSWTDIRVHRVGRGCADPCCRCCPWLRRSCGPWPSVERRPWLRRLQGSRQVDRGDAERRDQARSRRARRVRQRSPRTSSGRARCGPAGASAAAGAQRRDLPAQASGGQADAANDAAGRRRRPCAERGGGRRTRASATTCRQSRRRPMPASTSASAANSPTISGRD